MTPADQKRFPPQVVALKGGRTATIRPLSPADGDALAAFYAGVPNEDYRFYCPHPLDDAHARANAAKAESSLEVVLVLDLPDGGIGGYAWYRWPGPEAGRSGFGICMARGWQGCGAGRALMRRLLEIAEFIGPDLMTLTVQAANPGAVALYTSMGFRVVREQMRAPKSPNGFPSEPEFYMERRACRAGGRPTNEEKRT